MSLKFELWVKPTTQTLSTLEQVTEISPIRKVLEFTLANLLSCSNE